MDEKYIRENIVLEVLHGSRAYGTAIAQSDWDYKGIAILPDKKYYFGLSRFDQKNSGWLDGADRQIYGIKKFFKLAMACNPNLIETIFTPPHCLVKCTELGKRIILNRSKFLSQRAKNSYIGYALSERRKLERQMTLHGNFKTKQAMHLIRLLKMAYEVLTERTVRVSRTLIDSGELMEIRNGDWSIEEVFKRADELISNVDSVKTSLPPTPNYDELEELLISLVNEKVYGYAK